MHYIPPIADTGGKLEKEVELRQAAEERAATAEHQYSLLQLELKKSKTELQKVEEDLTSQHAMVSPAPGFSKCDYSITYSWRPSCVVIKRLNLVLKRRPAE